MKTIGHIAYLHTKKEYLEYLEERKQEAKSDIDVKEVDLTHLEFKKAVETVRNSNYPFPSFVLATYKHGDGIRYFAYYQFYSDFSHKTKDQIKNEFFNTDKQVTDFISYRKRAASN